MGLSAPRIWQGLGFDRRLNSNAAKARTRSVFCHDRMRHDLVPNMPEYRLAPLMAAFDRSARR